MYESCEEATVAEEQRVQGSRGEGEYSRRISLHQRETVTRTEWCARDNNRTRPDFDSALGTADSATTQPRSSRICGGQEWELSG